MIQTEVNAAKQGFESQMTPLKQAIGDNALKDFIGKVPNAVNYLPQMHKLMGDNPKLSITAAYGASAVDDLFQKGKDAQLKESQDRQIKLSKTPITKEADGKQVKGSGKMSIEDGIRAAMNESGA